MSEAIGRLIRRWRTDRGLSQATLAEEAEVSTRHLSCIETGKASPSREMVLVLASALDVPLRERNTMLVAAGFAEAYRESNLADVEMTHVRRALDLVLCRQEPYPGVVHDRTWNALMMNDGASRLLRTLVPDPSPLGPLVRNSMHMLFHPDGFRRCVVNWDEAAGAIVNRLHRDADRDDDLQELLRALLAYPGVPRRFHHPELGGVPDVLIPVHIRHEGRDIRLFTTLTSLGTPLDITAQELRIECYFPADDDTDRWLHEIAGG